MCKFTPLGFETYLKRSKKRQMKSVNLPRWGLKLFATKNIFRLKCVNLPRWGLKLSCFAFSSLTPAV